MFATTLALIAQEFEGPERATAFGIWGATVGGAVAIGPLVGGALTDGLGWEWIFFVNVPIGIAAIALTLTKVGESKQPDARAGGLARRRRLLLVAVPARLRARSRERRGLGELPDRRLAGRLAAAALCRFVAIEAALLAPDARPRPLPQARLRRRLDRRLLHCRPRCSRCSSTSRSTCRTCSGTTHSRPGVRFLPITLVSFFVGADRRPAPDPGPGARLLRRRPGPGRRRAAADGRAQRRLGVDRAARGLPVAGAGIGMTNPAIASVAIGVVPPRRRGWDPASTTPSARSGSRPGSPRSARSSSTGSRPGWWSTARPSGARRGRRRQRHPRRRGRAAAAAGGRPGRLHRLAQRAVPDRRDHRAGRRGTRVCC